MSENLLVDAKALRERISNGVISLWADKQAVFAADTFGGATGEEKARAFDVYGYAFLARKPADQIQTRRDPWQQTTRSLSA